jgi:hypothetical protein
MSVSWIGSLWIMSQRCQSCGSAVDSHATATSFVWQSCQSRIALFVMWQKFQPCHSGVLINQQYFWSCNSAFGHATELSIIQQCHWSCNNAVDHAIVLLMRHQCFWWGNSAICNHMTAIMSVLWHCCQSSCLTADSTFSYD